MGGTVKSIVVKVAVEVESREAIDRSLATREGRNNFHDSLLRSIVVKLKRQMLGRLAAVIVDRFPDKGFTVYTLRETKNWARIAKLVDISLMECVAGEYSRWFCRVLCAELKKNAGSGHDPFTAQAELQLRTTSIKACFRLDGQTIRLPRPLKSPRRDVVYKLSGNGQ